MKYILLIQFRTDKSAILHERKCFLRFFQKKKDLKLKIINAYDKKVDFTQPQKVIGKSQGIILGGSGEFNFSGNEKGKEKIFQAMLKRITPFIKYLLKNDFPILGICFGHQMIGHFLGKKVVNDKSQAETGSFLVFLTKEGRIDPLFRGLPKKFVCQFGHQDSLEALPEKAVLLAKSRKCKIVGFRYKKNIYGIQFHPEFNIKDIIFRLKLYPQYRPKKLKLKPSPEASKIIKNFVNFIVANNR